MKKITGKIALFLFLGICLIIPCKTAEAAEQSQDTVPIYRLYLPSNYEHLYTTSKREVRILTREHGWQYEGVGWFAPSSGIAVYRLYNPVLENHLNTTDLNEIRVLTTREGWVKDNNGEPLFYSGGSTPIYRLYNRDLRGLHLWTTDSNEYNVLPDRGWKQENIVFHAAAAGNPGYPFPDDYDKGSYGFFEYMGATDAINILDNSRYASYTHKGEVTDATNLENMKAAISWMRECNRLRKLHGLSELKVTYELMAMAQANANYSDTNTNHSQQFYVGENLAWGYRNPFDGWYTEEKKSYDAGIQDWNEVGHYLNIINGTYETTGFAVNTRGTWYGITYSQVFDYDGQNTMTIDEFEAIFNAYYGSV